MTSATEPVAEPTADPAAVPPSQRWRLAFVVPLVVAVPWLVVTGGSSLPVPLPTVAGAVLVLLALTTTTTDLTHRRIPNWATYTAALWGLALALLATVLPDAWVVAVPGVFGAAPQPVGTLFAGVPVGQAAGGFVVGFGVMFLLYGVFQGGAGDVKLVAASGALIGVERILPAIAYGYILAGICAACWLVWVVGPVGLFRELGGGMGMVKPAPEGTENPVLRRKIPMAPFLNAGILLSLFWQGP